MKVRLSPIRLVAEPLFRLLDEAIKEPLARRALRYDQRRPELLCLVVCCLELTAGGTNEGDLHLAAYTLRSVVTADCGWFYFSKDWIRANSPGQLADTRELRRDLLADLFEMLPRSCQQLALNKQPPKRSTTVHGCWSMGCSLHALDRSALSRSLERGPAGTGKKPARKARTNADPRRPRRASTLGQGAR